MALLNRTATVFIGVYGMAAVSFEERLRTLRERKASHLCVGLDPDLDRLPPHLTANLDPSEAVASFNRAVIDATAPFTAAYKLNLAFYEALGADGWPVVKATLEALPNDVVAIADGKRSDIGNSARFYARAAFDGFGFDACTVSGYMGRDSVMPFLEFEGKGIYLLARTSNPGGADFQELWCGEERLYERVVRAALNWADELPGSMGFVAGAADASALQRIRSLAPDWPLLIPGIGAQGGDAGAVMNATAEGSGPVLINSSRGILYASGGRDFAEAAGKAAEDLNELLQAYAGR